MSKLIFIMLFLVGFAFASKSLVLEICSPNFCYVQIIPDAKKWQYEYDFSGKKFIRVYFYNSRELLDIKADGLTVKQKNLIRKSKNKNYI